MNPAECPPRRIDEQALRKFGSIFIDPAAGCLECRVFKATKKNGYIVRKETKWPSVYSGWFDNVNDLIIEAGRLRGVSGYCTLNPVHPDLLKESGESRNKLAWAKDATKDKHITHLRWLFVDIDPVRPKDTSSTEDELRAALSRRDAILGDHPEMLASSLWGCSGNGAFLWIRLPDYPNDATHKKLIVRTLAALSRRYSDKVVEIDVKTKNPSRVGALPGSWKCKGPDTPERPWRIVTLDTPLNGREVAS
jgi:hypothetical protein